VVLPNSTPGMTESVLLAKLSELARATGVIVIETGEGADELFMGYSGYLTYLENGRRKMRHWSGSRCSAVCAPVARVQSRIRARIESHTGRTSSIRPRTRTIIKDFLYEPFLSYQAERIVAKKYRARPRHNKYWELNSSITSRIDTRRTTARRLLSVLWNASFRWAELLLMRCDTFTMTSVSRDAHPCWTSSV
jgi:hypothetical protein